jgi:hypothetical protein
MKMREERDKRRRYGEIKMRRERMADKVRR